MALLASTVTMGAVNLALIAGPASAADKNCPDFSTQQQAQQYFNAHGGSATNNFDNLDHDHDGIACEGLPRGSSQASGAATSTRSATHAKSAQVKRVPSGAAATGGGSTAGLQHEDLILGGAALVAAGALTGGAALRRRAAVGA